MAEKFEDIKGHKSKDRQRPNKQIGHKDKQRSAKQYTETQLKPLANSDVLEG